jgi:hypothetical protein
VVRTHNSGRAVFLNFSSDFNNSFAAVIFPEDWPKFPVAPEHLFSGKLVRVEGLVEAYQGTPEIIIREPWQIEVALTLGQPVMTSCNCQPPPAQSPTAVLAPTPVHTPTVVGLLTPAAPAEVETPVPVAGEPVVVSWQEAAAYNGQVVIVEGQVIDTYNSGKVVFLNFAEDFRTTFKVAIFPEVWPLFPAPPEDYYRARTIRVTGQVKMYENAPEIIVDQPDQIEIVAE